MAKGRVVVAMSGGVDSSLAAALLKEEGYEVIGATMSLLSEEGPATPKLRACCTTEDANDARQVCHTLDIPYYIFDFRREFQASVIDFLCQEYALGRTPNPCLACNQEIKFNFLLNNVLALGADYLATGHYARIDRSNGAYRLLKAIDPDKDQSYVLYALGQKELQHLLFPLGCHYKSEVRQLAARLGLRVAWKQESQDICFVPDGNYRRFITRYINPHPGELVNSAGEVLGRHDGVEFYTVGQREGLGLSLGRRVYVVDIDPVAGRVLVGSNEDLFSDSLLATRVNFISGERPRQSEVEIEAKIRYKSLQETAILEVNGREARVRFKRPQRAITPGQAVVFYRGEEVLGGGIIERSQDSPLAI